MPSIGFDTVLRFSWAELKEWHKAAFEVYKEMRGID
jgi:hypothetical protein